MTPVERSRAAVIGRVKWVGKGNKIVAYQIDLMGIGVGELQSQPVVIFHAQPCLKRMIAEISLVFLLANGAETRIDSIQIRIERPISDALAVYHIVEWQSVDGSKVILIPANRADILQDPNN